MAKITPEEAEEEAVEARQPESQELEEELRDSDENLPTIRSLEAATRSVAALARIYEAARPAN